MEIIITVFFALLGAVLASFIGVLSERLYTGEAWINDRSRCNSCARELGMRDLIPVFSWLASKGRCFSCHSRIPFQYALTELVLAGLFALSYHQLGLSYALVLFLLALSVLLFIVLYDLRHTVVPQGASNLLLIFSIGFAYLTAPSLISLGISGLVAGVIGLFFLALYVFSKGRAMGLGDAPVALALSLLVSSAAISGLLFSFWIGALVGIVILVRHPRGHRMGIEVPFVPFLAAGYLLAFFTQWNPFQF
ncbi:MAG: Prepilin peptidase [Parcubacteria group bacterium]|nr:Prepilin peptidase [Parcubacteria group bacterium]